MAGGQRPQRYLSFVADQDAPLPPVTVPCIELPFTRPVYCAAPAVKLMSFPRILPLAIFVDPIERKLKIEKNDLMSIYFRKQVEAQRNLRPG